MKILITTGIFPPASGGPATYAPKLAQSLAAVGHKLKVITLSDTKTHPKDEKYDFEVIRIQRKGKISNYLRFFWAVLKEVSDVDVVYTLSFFSYGFLTALAARLFRKPYLVRVGGDYLWEQFYLANNPPIPLRDFYEQELHKQYFLSFRIIRSILQSAAMVVFNSEVQRDMYEKAYALESEATTVVHNPVPETDADTQRTTANKEIIYAGRITPMKNVESLVQAFGTLRLPGYKLVIIGDGSRKEKVQELVSNLEIEDQTVFTDALPQEELFSRIVNARLVVQPSWTDISPNFIFECLALSVPFLVTEETYLPFRAEIPNMVDPRSVDDIARKINRLVRDESAYQSHQEQIQAISFRWSWDDITREHEELFTNSL